MNYSVLAANKELSVAIYVFKLIKEQAINKTANIISLAHCWTNENHNPNPNNILDTILIETKF